MPAVLPLLIIDVLIAAFYSQKSPLPCRQQVAAVMLSLEDELSVLDLRYADLLQSVQSLSGCDSEDAEVMLALTTWFGCCMITAALSCNKV